MARLGKNDAFKAMAQLVHHVQKNAPVGVLGAKSWSDDGHEATVPKASEAARFGAWLLDRVISGTPFFNNAKKLAQQYESYGDDAAARIAALVRFESARGFMVGFTAGLGGPLAAPVALPASVLATFLVQARMVAAIALLWGHSLEDPWVRTTILLVLQDSDSVDEAQTPKTKAFDLGWGELATKASGPLLASLQTRAARALIKRSSHRQAVTLGRALPIIGAVVGGTTDAVSCMRVAQRAQHLLKPSSISS